MERLSEQIRKRVLERIDLNRDVSDEEIRSYIQEEICLLGKEIFLSIEDRLQIQRRVFYSLRKLDILEDLLADDTITEIMINGFDQIYIERDGCIFPTKIRFSSQEKLDDIIQKIAADQNKIVNASHPIMDTRLVDGTRVNVVLPPVSINGSMMTIRKFPKDRITMEKLMEWNSLSKEIAEFIRKLVIARYNIFVSGGTGSGKTSFLGAMSAFIPEDERVITIEDAAELQLIGVNNLVRLEARDATMEGKLEVSIRDLVRASLRMRPDRIIVGECRGKEALEVMQSFGTGHDGSFSTGHANSARDMVSRLETMALMAGEMPLPAIRSQIVSGVDIIIHLGRMKDKSRKLLEIVEVIGMKKGEVELRTLYEYRKENGKDQWIEKNSLQHVEKLHRAEITQ